jgi:adenine deaminase
MTSLEADNVAEKTKSLENFAAQLGCKVKNPFMALSFLSLPVIPKLKITDFGLIDAKELRVVSVFID